MKIKIKGTNYDVKYSLRAMFVWEQVMDRTFNLKTTLDNIMFFYCMLLSSNPDKTLSWDDFIDALDTDPTISKQLEQIVVEQVTKQQLFSDQKKSKEKEESLA